MRLDQIGEARDQAFSADGGQAGPAPVIEGAARGLHGGIDIAGPIDAGHIAQIKAAGIDAVLGYFSWNSRKNWTRAEALALSAAGIQCGSVWEAAGDKYTSFTEALGIKDATYKIAQLGNVNMTLTLNVTLDAASLESELVVKRPSGAIHGALNQLANIEGKVFHPTGTTMGSLENKSGTG